MTFLFRQHENISVNNKANSPNNLWEQNMKHNYYYFVASLRCDKTFSLNCYITVALCFLIKHYNTPVMQAKQGNMVQRGRRDTAILILDLGYRWQGGGGSHHTANLSSRKRPNTVGRFDGPYGHHEWEWWRESLEPPSVIPNTLCRLLKYSKVQKNQKSFLSSSHTLLDAGFHYYIFNTVLKCMKGYPPYRLHCYQCRPSSNCISRYLASGGT